MTEAPRLPCPICGDIPKRDDEGIGLVPGISMGFYAVLKSECGLRLRRWSSPDGKTDVEKKWNEMARRWQDRDASGATIDMECVD